MLLTLHSSLREVVAVTLVLFGATFPVCFQAQTPADLKTQTANTPQERLQLAEGLLDREFYEMAEEQFRRFLDNHGDHERAPSAMFGLTESLRGQEKFQDCISTINQFHAQWPEHELAPKLSLWKGELLLQQGKLTQAKNVLKRLRFSPDTAVREAAIYFLARSYGEEGKLKKALETFRKIAQKDFDADHEYRPYALYAVARYEQMQGNRKDTISAFKRLTEEDNVPDKLRAQAIYRLAENLRRDQKYQKAIELFERLLVEYAEKPFIGDVQNQRASAYFSLGDYEKAKEIAEELQKEHPDRYDYQLEFILGASYAALEKADKALPYLQRLSKATKPPATYRRLASYHAVRMYLERGDYEKTRELGEDFLENFPDAPEKPEIYYFLGEAYFQSKEYKEAISPFEKAMSKGNDPQNLRQTGFRLAECHRQLDNPTKAAAVYRKIAEKLPDDKREAKAHARLEAARTLRQTENWEKAVEDFQKVLQEYPDVLPYSRVAAKLLGETYTAHGQFDEAVSIIQDLIEETDTEAEEQQLQFFLGYLNYRQENYNEAETLLKRAVESDAQSSILYDAKYFLTGVLLEQEKTDEALETFAPLLKLPAEQRPDFAADFLFQLERVYFRDNKYEVSKDICKWLAEDSDSSVAYRAKLRLAEVLLKTGELDKAKAVLQRAQDEFGGKEKIEGEALIRAPMGEISSLLGELYLKTDQYDRAVSAFEQTLNTNGVSQVHKTRANWGMARIFFEEEKYEEARGFATSAFVLGNHPVYVPQSMLVAMKAFYHLDRIQKASSTWEELKKRYPAFAQQHRNEDLVQKVVEASTDGGEKREIDSNEQ